VIKLSTLASLADVPLFIVYRLWLKS